MSGFQSVNVPQLLSQLLSRICRIQLSLSRSVSFGATPPLKVQLGSNQTRLSKAKRRQPDTAALQLQIFYLLIYFDLFECRCVAIHTSIQQGAPLSYPPGGLDESGAASSGSVDVGVGESLQQDSGSGDVTPRHAQARLHLALRTLCHVVGHLRTWRSLPSDVLQRDVRACMGVCVSSPKQLC